MTYFKIPLTTEPWQVFTIDAEIDGEAFQLQGEVRYLPAPDAWFFSLWDHSTGELLVNMIPLICSYGALSDLLSPFRFLREGKGVGSLFCVRATDHPSTADPAGDNLAEFQLIYGDTLDE